MNLEVIKRAAKVIKGGKFVVALTGAGISVESGIPAFRGSQGLWDRYDPFEYAHISSFYRNPEKVWNMLRELYDICLRAEPNPAHYALAKLEEAGILKAIITQNVDGLHQRAGSKEVIEFHGNGETLACVDCKQKFRITEVDYRNSVPRCSCGGLLKPDIVFFGEMIPHVALERSVELTKKSDVFLVIGTSAQVYPAGGLPVMAKERGSIVVEINLEPTPLTNTVTDVFISGKAGEVLPKLISLVLDN